MTRAAESVAPDVPLKDGESVRAGRQVPSGSKGAVPGTCLFSAVRNEAPFLVEWIAYHKVIGFERFLIFANPSTDGTDELLAALHDAGEITYVPHEPPAGVAAQPNAVRLANEGNYIPDGAWVAWLDADEFLNIHHADGRLDSLIEWMGDRVCMLIQWKVFGDNGHAGFGGRFVSGDFVKAATPDDPVNDEIKSFFRKGNGITGFSSTDIHRPAVSRNRHLTPAAVATGSGRQLLSNRRSKAWLSGKAGGHNKTAPADRGFEIAQVNHYTVRTPEFFLLKRVRGAGYRADQEGVVNPRHRASYYRTYNRNEAEDRSILRWEAACGREMARLLAIPSVRAAHDAAMEKVRQEISRLSAEALAELTGDRPQEEVTGPAPEEPPAPAQPGFRLTLPDQEAEALERAYASARVVLEYGSGGSTFLALRSGAEFVMSVESDKAWSERIGAALGAEFPADRFLVHHADIGPTGPWGRPAGSGAYRRFHLYATGIWDRPGFRHPDVVLIDGRFRVACFLAAMIRCTRPVTVLFDDYIDRKYYHWIEELIPRDELTGRMARFTVCPQSLPPEQLTRFAGAFTDPR